jgi:ABC-type Fe3+ transport system substrate-binding protein
MQAISQVIAYIIIDTTATMTNYPSEGGASFIPALTPMIAAAKRAAHADLIIRWFLS